jgi:hypothetical protein
MLLAHLNALVRGHSLRVWLLWGACILVLAAIPFAFADPAGWLLLVDPELAALVSTASLALVLAHGKRLLRRSGV